MANGIAGGLEDILGLDTTAGTGELQQAIAALQGVGVPSIAQLTLPELQKYVVAGVLSPSQYKAISADPQTYQNLANQADQTGVSAQKAALQQLGGIAQKGSTPIMQAQLLNAVNTANQNAQANRGAVMENAQERGVAGSGLEFMNQLQGNQTAATNANQGAVQAGANNAQLALQALAGQGQLGGNVQSEANTMATNKAQAAQQIAEYNSQLQSMANQYNTEQANQAQAANLANAQGISNQNTGLQNFRTQYNAQLPGQEFNMQMQKAGGLAGAYGNMGQLKQQQAQGQNQFIGGLLGAGATMGGDYMLGQGIGTAGAGQRQPQGSQIPGGATNPSVYPGYDQNAINNQPFAHGGEVCYAQGGEIHDHALCMVAGGNVPGQPNVPGDSTQNDTVPAKLSPGEVVLPRTVAQAPNAPQAASQFVQQVKGQPGKVNSFADAIKIMEDNGLELRLCPTGY